MSFGLTNAPAYFMN
jgi:hypothetical protein